jgi:hypothetical protein
VTLAEAGESRRFIADPQSRHSKGYPYRAPARQRLSGVQGPAESLRGEGALESFYGQNLWCSRRDNYNLFRGEIGATIAGPAPKLRQAHQEGRHAGCRRDRHPVKGHPWAVVGRLGPVWVHEPVSFRPADRLMPVNTGRSGGTATTKTDQRGRESATIASPPRNQIDRETVVALCGASNAIAAVAI